MPDLQYDTECMRKSAKTFYEKAELLITVKDDLKKQIDDLKSIYWQSDAGDAFMNMYKDTWADNVEKYAAVLKEMSKLLEKAADDYDEVSKEAANLDGFSI